MKQGAKFLLSAGFVVGTIGVSVVAFPQITEAAANTYTVQSGDTLWGISRKFEVTVQNLVNWNNIADPSKIYPGQVLMVSQSIDNGNGGGNTTTPIPEPIFDPVSKGKENITDATYALMLLSDGNQAVFTDADHTRKTFYSSLLPLWLDPNAGNRLYKISEHGYTYYSPIRPKSGQKGGVSTGEYIFENMRVEYNRGTLQDLWVANPSITRNFKTKQVVIDKQAAATNYEQAQQVGVFVEESPFVNNGGNFKDMTGKWRFNGYSQDGASSQDGLLPHDYIASDIRNTNWDYYEDYGSRLFKPHSIYNGKDYQGAKLNLIHRLMKQIPEMNFKTDQEWMKILALQTIPEVNPLTGDRDGNYGGASFTAYNTKGRFYRSFILFTNDKTEGSDNLTLQKLALAENTSDYPVIKSVTRREPETRNTYVDYERKEAIVVPGQTYQILTSVLNQNQLVSTEYSPTTVDTGFAKNYDTSLEPENQYNKAYDSISGSATNAGTIPAGGTVRPQGTLTIPEDAQPGSLIRLGTVINEKHQEAGDNLNPVDDDLILTVKVATGNLKAKEVTLVDENGKEVAEPIPGHQYKVRYKFEYNGPTLATSTKVTVNYKNTRKLPDGNTPAGASEVIQDDTSASKDIRLVDGNSYSIDTQAYQWYEIPWVSTEAYLSSGVSGLNANRNDDLWSRTWDPQYDYSIKNLQVIPRTEFSNTEATDGKQHYGVSFTVVSDMPKAAADDNYAKDVSINVNLGGVNKVIKEHIVAGQNKDIVVDMAFDNPVSANSVVNAVVSVNSDARAYEYGTGDSNNIANTRVNTNNLYKDTRTNTVVNPTNTSSNTGAYTTENVNPNEMTRGNTDNKNNSWYQTYDVESWSGQQITYTARNGQKAFSFYRYTPTSSNAQTVRQQESYEIQNVWMKSKVTTDNGWGENGWVSLLDDAGHAQVKAGYGYELKMRVAYNTNALSTEPLAYINGGSGVSVRPQNVKPNIAKDAYFQTSDGKILSTSGTNNTNGALTARIVEQSDEKLVVEYTLKETYTMGIRTPGRIYISEDTPNGVYNVRAWTPMINGVPTKNRSVSNGWSIYTPDPLWDILGDRVSSTPTPLPTRGTDAEGNPIIDTSRIPDMSIVVVGSDKDDLVNSVVQ